MRDVWGLEIEKGRIGLCQIRQASDGLQFKRGASLPLPPGLVTPSLTESNVPDEQEFVSQLRSLMNEVGWKGGSVVLVLSDLTCRIGFQDFDELKGTHSETRQLLSWRLKDRLPFASQEARIDCQALPWQENGTRLLYLVAREAVIAQYETLLANAGLEPTRVITRGAALYRLHQVAHISDKRLFLAPGPSSIVLIYAEEEVPRLWRTLPWNGREDRHGGNYHAQRLVRELHETLGYLRDEMQVEAPDRVCLMGGSDTSLAEWVTKAGRLPVCTTPPESQDGVPTELLAPAGAALFHKPWMPEWTSRLTWPRPRR
jgi:hypothetical protein